MSDLQIKSPSTTPPLATEPPKRMLVNGYGIETIGKKFSDAMKTAELDKGFKKLMANIKLTGFSEKSDKDNTSENTIINDAIKNLYYGSKTARKILDKLGNQPFTHPKLEVINDPDLREWDKSVVSRHEKKIYIHPYPDGYSFKNDNKLSVIPSVERALAHELSHAINKTEDNHTPKHPTGDTVDVANKIMEELEGSDQRIEY